MKKINKYITVIILLFLSGCNGGCWFSDGCFARRDREIIEKMTDEEREHSKQQCIKAIQHMIDITPNEKRQCDFWGCKAGKESFREDLRRCNVMYNNNKKKANE